ncbi:hypothetical protein BB559_003337 [Furculomyces boomerangus]|uniref:Major facilitator superfamily (MFS) profile domain-containing protein n=2 Tax=Harpellales TaxID=61421 RepID=A0A2T9YM24_9FUNG|nr:hypothetical protein BB559_006346 [Furculomyces boomerangus]PVU86904.1 hypothetical protein BB559_006342 [Furculomyces boomerangus]PVU89554.1 hypothetical protein BB559_005032 [Furculomyces boomerangus]PVU93324.1 hypothetical protein BB559_003337 [Furculomyces boomerangus]PWA03331.1 hypothetical protein BB558_000513 [Smittium angustum]
MDTLETISNKFGENKSNHEVDLESKTLTIEFPPENETPPDSGYAWLMLTSGLLNYMVSFGSINAFGVFQTYYLLQMFPNEPARDISWISTMAIAFSFVGGIFGSPLIARFGLRGANRVGTLIGVIGLLSASFCSKIWQLVITQGLIFGIGGSIVINVSVVIPSLWFEKYLGLALGIIVSGSALGSLILSPITTAALKTLGIRWTFRLLSLIFLLFTGFGSLFLRPRKTFVAAKHIINFKHLKDRVVILLCISSFFFQMGYSIILLYFSPSIVALGTTKQLATNLIMVFSVFSGIGRILGGQLSKKLGPLTIVIFSHSVTGIVITVMWNLGKTLPVYIVAYILIGLFSVPYFVLGPAIIAKHYPKKYVSQVNGLVSLSMGLSVIVGVPVAGLIFDVVGKRNNYTWVKIYSGVCYLATLLFLVLLRITLKADPKYKQSRL